MHFNLRSLNQVNPQISDLNEQINFTNLEFCNNLMCTNYNPSAKNPGVLFPMYNSVSIKIPLSWILNQISLFIR